MARKGTVESSLSAEALHEFCEKLAALPNLTLRRMQDEAKKLGITLSRSAAGRLAWAGEAASARQRRPSATNRRAASPGARRFFQNAQPRIRS